MATPYDTDQRLKDWLDTNQLGRERLCRAVLALDKRFSDVRPRHPRGGPDGGLDIAAIFEGQHVTACASGFLNGANDSDEQKKTIADKFLDDATSAKAAGTNPVVFVFMTNLNLTLGEKANLQKRATAIGFMDCEIFDRERLRIALDSPDGFAARFQYLGLPLSEAEQASFFAKWGDDIQSMVSTGFQRLERSLDRVLFLMEASDVLESLTIRYELNRSYDADEIGHFRAFARMFLRDFKHGVFSVIFGTCDGADRFRNDRNARLDDMPRGIKHGISGAQWEQQIDLEETSSADAKSGENNEAQLPPYVIGCISSSIGQDTVRSVDANFSYSDSLFRFRWGICLKDLDGAMWLPVLSASIAEKVAAIHVFANGYKLDEIKIADCYIDRAPSTHEELDWFSPDELADPWVCIRPNRASSFFMRFFEQTPVRLFRSKQTANSLRFPWMESFGDGP